MAVANHTDIANNLEKLAGSLLAQWGNAYQVFNYASKNYEARQLAQNDGTTVLIMRMRADGMTEQTWSSYYNDPAATFKAITLGIEYQELNQVQGNLVFLYKL